LVGGTRFAGAARACGATAAANRDGLGVHRAPERVGRCGGILATHGGDRRGGDVHIVAIGADLVAARFAIAILGVLAFIARVVGYAGVVFAAVVLLSVVFVFVVFVVGVFVFVFVVFGVVLVAAIARLGVAGRIVGIALVIDV